MSLSTRLIEKSWTEVTDWQTRKGQQRFVFDDNNLVTSDPSIKMVLQKKREYKAIKEWEENGVVQQKDIDIITRTCYSERRRRGKDQILKEWKEVLDWREREGKKLLVFEDNVPVRENELVTSVLMTGEGTQIKYKAVIKWKESDVEHQQEAKVITRDTYNKDHTSDKDWEEVIDWRNRKNKHILVFQDNTPVTENKLVTSVLMTGEGTHTKYKAVIVWEENGVKCRKDVGIMTKNSYQKHKGKQKHKENNGQQDDNWKEAKGWQERENKNRLVFLDNTLVTENKLVTMVLMKGEAQNREYKAILEWKENDVEKREEVKVIPRRIYNKEHSSDNGWEEDNAEQPQEKKVSFIKTSQHQPSALKSGVKRNGEEQNSEDTSRPKKKRKIQTITTPVSTNIGNSTIDFSSVQSEQVVIKKEPAHTLPTSHHWSKSLSFEQLLNNLRKAVKILVGNKEAVKSCELLADGIIHYWQTGELPTEPIPDQTPSTTPPLVTIRMVPIKEEGEANCAHQKHRPEIIGIATRSINNRNTMSNTYVPPSTYLEGNNIIHDLEEYREPSVHYLNLENVLKKQAKNARDQIAFGKIQLERSESTLNKTIKAAGHTLVYIVIAGEVIYIDCEKYNGRTKAGNPIIQKPLQEVYDIAGDIDDETGLIKTPKTTDKVFGFYIYLQPMHSSLPITTHDEIDVMDIDDHSLSTTTTTTITTANRKSDLIIKIPRAILIKEGIFKDTALPEEPAKQKPAFEDIAKNNCL